MTLKSMEIKVILSVYEKMVSYGERISARNREKRKISQGH